MSEYNVRLPVAGIVSILVEADSEQEAIQKAKEIGWNMRIETGDKNGDVHLDEIDSYDPISEGISFHGPLNEIETEIVD